MKTKNKQTSRTGTESEKWRSHGRFSVGRGTGGIGGKATRKKKHNWSALNRWGEVKNGIGNRELKELICTTHGNELRWENAGGSWGAGWREDKGRNIGKTVIA